MRILHTMLRVGDLERAIDFYPIYGRRSLDKASYFRAYRFTGSVATVPPEVPAYNFGEVR